MLNDIYRKGLIKIKVPDKTKEQNKFIITVWNENKDSVEALCKVKLKGRYREYIDDCIQNTFLAFQEAMISEKDIENPKGLLYKIAYYKIVEIIRSEKKKEKNIVYLPDLYDTEEKNIELSVEINIETITEEQIDEYKEEILSQLSDKEKQLLYDITVRKLKLAEIADNQNISVSKVKKQSTNLKKKIKRLVKNFVESNDL